MTNAKKRNHEVNSHDHQEQRGFSLVEVLIAMGVVVVSFIPLMGLMSMGLGYLSKSTSSSVQTQICQKLHSQALQTPYAKLPLSVGVFRAFNVDGDEVALTNPSVVYRAWLDPVETPVSNMLADSLGVTSSQITSLRIIILPRIDPAMLTPSELNAEVKRSGTAFPIMISNMGL